MKGIWIKVNRLPFNSNGLTLFPFVFYKPHADCEQLRRHEIIHLYQQLEMLVLPFYVWYLIEWCLRRIQVDSWMKAYRNISFEQEAYNYDSYNNYLEQRKLFRWIKYLKTKWSI